MNTPDPLRKFDPSTPVDLETIICKAISKYPRDRYRSCQELSDDLQRFVDFKPVKALRPSLANSARKWCLRNKLIVISAATIFLALVAGLSLSVLQWQRAVRAEMAATEQAYASDMQVAFAAWEQGRLETSIEILGRHGEHRDKLEWRLLNAKIESEIAPSRIETPPKIYEVSFSPDGDYVAALLAKKCMIWKYPSSVLHAEFDRHGHATSSMRFVNDLLLYTDTDNGKSRESLGLIRIVNLNDGKLVATLQTPDRNAELTGISFDAKGDLFTCMDVQGRTGAVFRLEDFKSVPLDGSARELEEVDEAEKGEELLRFCYSKSGSLLASVQIGSEVWLRDPQSWELRERLGVCGGLVHRVLFSPNERFLAATGASNNMGHDTRLRIWDISTKKEISVLSESESAGSLIFVPRGLK